MIAPWVLLVVLNAQAAETSSKDEPQEAVPSTTTSRNVSGQVDMAMELRRFNDRNASNVGGLPIWARLRFASDLGDMGALGKGRVMVLGFGRLQTLDDRQLDNNGDLTLLYVSSQKKGLNLNVGRHILPFAGGGARMKTIDGISARYLSKAGTEFGAYMGIEPLRRLRYNPNRWRTGGVLSQHGKNWSLGVRLDQRLGDTTRTNTGMLGSYTLGAWRLFGFGDLNVQRRVLREARVALSYDESIWHVLADTRYAAPDLLITEDSIFWVFGADPRLAPGLEVNLTPSDYWSVTARARTWLFGDVSSFSTNDMGYIAGLDVRTYREKSKRSSIGLSLERLVNSTGNANSDSRVRSRLFTHLQIKEALGVGGEVQLERYDRAMALGTPNAQWTIAALAHAQYAIKQRLVIAATLGAQRTRYDAFSLWGQLHLRYAIANGDTAR